MDPLEEHLERSSSLIKAFQQASKQELEKRVEGSSKAYLRDFEENYSDLMFINTIFANDRSLDQIIREVCPAIKCKHSKQEEKKLLRYIGKVFLEELVEISVAAKQDMGKESLDAQCIAEGYRRYEESHPPIRKNKSARRFL